MLNNWWEKVIYATNVLSSSDVDVTNIFCSHEKAGVPSTACKEYTSCAERIQKIVDM